MNKGTKGKPAHRDSRRNAWSRTAVPVLILLALICGVSLGAVKQSIDSSAAAPTSASSGPDTPSASPSSGEQGTAHPEVDPAPPAQSPASDQSASDQPSANQPSAGPVASAPVRLSIESADISVEVLELTPNEDEVASQSIVPPLTDDGYWLSSYGQPGLGSTNTTYLAGHSWEGREAPFNRLSTNAAPGDTVTVETQTGTLDFVVDTIATYNKETLKNSDIWDVVPNQLVIISCYTEDLWGKNVVITASPA